MMVNGYIDTDGGAAEVVVLMSMEDGISQNDAMHIHGFGDLPQIDRRSGGMRPEAVRNSPDVP